MTEEQVLRSKRLLKEILDNPLFNEVMREVRASIADDIFESKTKEQREQLYSEAMVLQRFTGRLQALVNDLSMIMVKRHG